MISIKSSIEIERMKESGKILSKVHEIAKKSIKESMTTYELDKIIHHEIKAFGAKPSFLNYEGFPASSCLSVNDVIVHGIPSKSIVLNEGDIISIDIGVLYKGLHTDAARTYGVGKISKEDKNLIEVTKQSFFKAMEFCKNSYRVSDISHAIQSYVESFGYSLVRELTGHGVGTSLHEDPAIPNYGRPGRGAKLVEGMTIAIEPMVNYGKKEIVIMDDDWTIKTRDGSKSAHYENTILITQSDAEILTLMSEEIYE